MNKKVFILLILIIIVASALRLWQLGKVPSSPDWDEVAFCFLDAEKEMYIEIYKEIVPRLLPNGLLVADNVISHKEELAAFVEHARNDPGVDAVVLPVGKGLLVCTKREN